MDLNTDTSLMVDISDALSERDRVKFTVHTKVRKRSVHFTPNFPCWSTLFIDDCLTARKMRFLLDHPAQF